MRSTAARRAEEIAIGSNRQRRDSRFAVRNDVDGWVAEITCINAVLSNDGVVVGQITLAERWRAKEEQRDCTRDRVTFHSGSVRLRMQDEQRQAIWNALNRSPMLGAARIVFDMNGADKIDRAIGSRVRGVSS